MNDLAAEGVELSLVAQLVQVVAPGPDGPGRVPAARGRAVALRFEPLSKAQRLAPVGLPSADGVQDFDRCALDDLVPRWPPKFPHLWPLQTPPPEVIGDGL